MYKHLYGDTNKYIKDTGNTINEGICDEGMKECTVLCVNNHENPDNRIISRRVRSTRGTPCCIADALRVSAKTTRKRHARCMRSAQGTRGQKGSRQMDERMAINQPAIPSLYTF